MKNAIGMILAVVMAIACMCFVQAAAAEQTEVEVLGGWERPESPEITEEIQTLCDKGFEGMTHAGSAAGHAGRRWDKLPHSVPFRSRRTGHGGGLRHRHAVRRLGRNCRAAGYRHSLRQNSAPRSAIREAS